MNPKDISLQTMDDVLVARNEQGHLTAPMLFLNREAVPDDAEDWNAVLVFSDGKTRATIDSTIIILHEGNDFIQTLEVETGGAWTISNVDKERVYIDPEQKAGVGTAHIEIRRAVKFDDPGFYASEFLLSIDGAIVNESTIQVYIFNSGLGVIRRRSITLNEDNEYAQLLKVDVLPEYVIDGENKKYFTVTEQSTGGFLIEACKPTPMDYDGVFTIVSLDPADATIVRIEVDVSAPLRVSKDGGYTFVTHGQSLTVTLTPNSSDRCLHIYRDRYWEATGVETDKITVTPDSGNGESTATVTISISPSLEVNEMVPTQFRIVSQNQWVDVFVEIQPPISGEFIDPPGGVAGINGAPKGTAPVYIYV